MKVCNWCHEVLPLSSFSFRSVRDGKRQPYCKRCIQEYCKGHYAAHKAEHNRRRVGNWRRYRERNRNRLIEFLVSQCCSDCGESDPRVLEFDHVSGEKQGNVSEMVSVGMAWSRIEAEIRKCVIRCANCHRRKTAQQFQWFKVADGA